MMTNKERRAPSIIGTGYFCASSRSMKPLATWTGFAITFTVLLHSGEGFVVKDVAPRAFSVAMASSFAKGPNEPLAPLLLTNQEKKTKYPSNKLLQAVLTMPLDLMLVESEVEELVESPKSAWTYDPTESIYGPLFCTMAAFTPGDRNGKAPLWEQISLRKDNIKGQQYSARTDQGPPDIAGTLINYAEIWGSSFHIRATGSCVPVNDNQADARNKSFWLDNFVRNGKNSTKRKCPDDYVATVNGASLHLGPFIWKLPIEGSSVQRILYADRQLRIFASPGSSESVVGPWEESGLVVVQVRSDLVTGTFIDLR